MKVCDPFLDQKDSAQVDIKYIYIYIYNEGTASLCSKDRLRLTSFSFDVVVMFKPMVALMSL